MPSSIRTSKQSPSEIITSLAEHSNDCAAVSSLAGLLEFAADKNAPLTCSSIADHAARGRNAFVGGVA